MNIRSALLICALLAGAVPAPARAQPAGRGPAALVTPDAAHFLFPRSARTRWRWDQPSVQVNHLEYAWRVEVPIGPDAAYQFGYSRYRFPCDEPGEGSLADLLNRGPTSLHLREGRRGTLIPTSAVGTRMEDGRVLVSVTDPALVQRVFAQQPDSVTFEMVLDGQSREGPVAVRYAPTLADAGWSLSGPDFAAPPGAPYTAEEVRIRTDAGHVLAGTLTRPLGAAAPPVAVLITGSGVDDRDYFGAFRQVADSLGRRGIAVLRLDDRGVGASTGDMETAATADRADDIRQALRFLRGRGDLDASRVALMGHSEGGLIAPALAETEPSVRALVLMAAPGSDADSIFVFQESQRAPECAEAERGPRRSTPWMEFIRRHDPLQTARRVRVPVLLLHGTEDKQVPVRDVERLAEALRAGGNAAVQVHVLRGLSHGLGDPASPEGVGGFAPEVIQTLSSWLVTQLRP